MYANIKRIRYSVIILREKDVLKNMAKWTKMQDTQITIPQNTYASIYMMAKLLLAKLKDYQIA